MKDKMSNKELALLVVLFLAYALIPFAFGQPNCVFKATFGLPCPGCGMTRACLAAAQLNFAEALYFHPLFGLIPLAIIALLVSRFSGRAIPRPLIYSAAVLMLVVYIFRMLTMFPTQPPMDYNPDSILGLIFMR